jgi:hypothetical protein
MEEPKNNDLPEHKPDETPQPDQKQLKQPIIRKYALIFIAITILGLIGVAWLAYTLSQPVQNSTPNSSGNTQQSANQNVSSQPITWEGKGDGSWTVLGGATPPACPEPLFSQSPTDISEATAVLYPGQTRGGNYKPHGGFRFDTNKHDQIAVKMPFDATVYRGSQYIEDSEVQYMFDLVHPCGMMVRFDHLHTLSDRFKPLASKFPAPTDSSRTERVNPPVEVKAGDIVATAVGYSKKANTFFDFGVYDLRKENDASKQTAFQQAHTNDKELSWHALCWFDLLPGPDASTVKVLPAGDPASGKISDYCK